MKKKILILLALFTMIVSLAGCNGNETENGNANEDTTNETVNTGGNIRDELIIGLSAEPATLDPHIQSGQATRLIKQNLYRGLVGFQADEKIDMEIAESYEISDDNLTYTFKIKSDAVFHDGSPITAEDVKFSIERIMDENTGATFGNDFRLVVDSVSVVDDKTVDIKLKAPTAPFIEMLTLPESVIVSKQWVENGGDFNENPVGNGPYKFVSWEKGREILLTKDDNFYKSDKPKTNNLRFTFIPDATTRSNALRTEEVYLIDYVPSNEVIAFEKEPGIEVDISEAPFMMLQFNTEEGPLSDARVRRAIAYAVDRQAVIDTAFMGRGTPLYGFPTRVGQNGYDGKFENYFSHDIEKAKELLAEAGYPDGFKTKILATSTYEFHEKTALVVQDSLKQIGIEAEVELPDWATRIERSNVGDYEILVSGTAGNIVDMDWATNYYLSGPTRMNSSPGFSDPEIDRLLNLGRETLDEEERIKIYDEFRERALEQSNFVYLNYREQSFARRDYVDGFKNLDGILTYNSGITLEDTVAYE